MKSAEEWANKVGETVMTDCFAGDRSALPGDPTISLIKQIQLDAWKQGMSDAAGQLKLDLHHKNQQGFCYCSRCEEIRNTYNRVLTARDDRKEI